MKPQPQPISHSIAFFGALIVVLSLFLSRPESLETLVWEFPRWETLSSADSSMTSAGAQNLLSSYRYSTSNSSSVPTESAQESPVGPHVGAASYDAFSLPDTAPSVSILLPTAAALPVSFSNYDRSNAVDLLHSDLLLSGSPTSFQRLSTFFSKLNEPKRTPSLHVFHFGDSQIEGDRITGDLRSKWQATWGGVGPGFLSPMQPIPSLAMKQKWSEGWKRFTRFGKVDTTIKHTRYGMMASFSIYKTAADSSNEWIEFMPHPRSYLSNRDFDEIHLALGRTAPHTSATFQLNGDTIETIQLGADSTSSNHIIVLPKDAIDATNFESLRLSFDGESPEINAVGLYSQSGIAVHNVAMRGSSGTLFRQLDRMQLKSQLQSVRTELVLLQYGGNAVPYLKDSSAVVRYGGWFASQIRLFQSLVPGIPVIVIGPSDMCTKVGTRMQTYPMLPYVRDVLKASTVQEDALYWDVFDVMGGAGAMAAWVASTPSLASSDHIHFTPKGAREIASLFNQSIQTEWALWQAWQADQTIATE